MTSTHLRRFFYLTQTSEIMKDCYNDIYIFDFSCVPAFRNYGDVLFGMKRDVFLNTMASGNLFKAELLKKEERHNRHYERLKCNMCHWAKKVNLDYTAWHKVDCCEHCREKIL